MTTTKIYGIQLTREAELSLLEEIKKMFPNTQFSYISLDEDSLWLTVQCEDDLISPISHAIVCTISFQRKQYVSVISKSIFKTFITIKNPFAEFKLCTKCNENPVKVGSSSDICEWCK